MAADRPVTVRDLLTFRGGFGMILASPSEYPILAGWGFGLSIIDPPDIAGTGPKGYGWSGGFGTVWVTDPEEDLVAILCTQVLASASGWATETAFWSAVYQALDA